MRQENSTSARERLDAAREEARALLARPDPVEAVALALLYARERLRIAEAAR